MVKLLLLLPLATVAMVTGFTYIEDRYEVDKSMGAFSHHVIDEITGRSYVGATNRIYVFDKDLNVLQEVETGPEMDTPLCPPRQYICEKKDEATKRPMNCYNKALLIDYDDNKLIACCSLFHGYCEKRNLDDITQKDPDNFVPLVANNATATTVAFIAPGPVVGSRQQNVLYVGASRTNTGSSDDRDSLVPAFSMRSLADYTFIYDGITAKTLKKIGTLLVDSFHIYYIYGFSSNNFSYMVTVQKLNPTTETYISKIFRVCQKDEKFYSYTEVHLQCRHNGMLYNLSQAAYKGKAGSNLGTMLLVPVTEDVLYVVFSKEANPNSAVPGKESAICVYPLREIRKKFTENIQACFQGQGNTGPQYILQPNQCSRTTFDITDDYCGDYDINNPIDGVMPIIADAAITFNYTGSAITVASVNGNTVAFVGTANGHLLKVAIQEQTVATLYEDVSIDEGNKINADMFVDSDQKHLFTMTARKLLKVRLYDCSQYTTCATCLGARDPYCGWCSLENKCSLKTDCKEYSQDLRWLETYSGRTCTKITQVIPDKIQKEHQKTTQLHLNISNLPSFTGNYQCVFSGYGMKIPTTNTTVPMGSQNSLTCETPPPHLLPPIPTGEDHIVMDLSVQISGRDFVTTNFTFFDCSVHTGCTDCTLSGFQCTWCINNHMCTHDSNENCLDNELVAGQNTGQVAEIGPEACPRIELEEYSDHEDSKFKILVPSGTKKKITVVAKNLRSFQTPVRCFFNIHSGKDVQATVTTKSDNKAIIECDGVKFSYTEESPRMNVPFHISWSNSKTLDNPEKLQVEMYKCHAMADTCGDCFKMPEGYKCGWCNEQCMINILCRGAQQWLPRTATCPDPEIYSFHPMSGPKAGGTRLTIHGKNLGNEFDDIINGVTVAGSQCTPDRNSYIPPEKIVCVTGLEQNMPRGSVQVYIDSKYLAESAEQFRYVEPVLISVSPQSGPISGGTSVTVRGNSLDAGTRHQVSIGQYNCPIRSVTDTQIVCETTIARNYGSQNIEVQFDFQTVSSNIKYTYVEDPEISTIEPKKAIVSGGINITVTGTSLHTIQNPYMLLWLGSQRYQGDCEKPSSDGKTMLCYSPSVLNTTVADDNIEGVDFGYGFVLDNVTSVLNLSKANEDKYGFFTVFPDPKFDPFPGNKEKAYQSKNDYLTINGKNLNLGIQRKDVTVLVGKGFCNVTSVGTQLTCQPPKTQPSSRYGGNQHPEITVKIGRNLSIDIGYLKYEKTEAISVELIIGLGVGGGVLVLIVIFFFVLWCIKSRENTSMKKKWQIQMDNLEAKVAKECKEAFAELQTDMTELTSDHFGQVAIPFWDYRTYCMRVLFPQDDDHPVIRDLDVPDYEARLRIEEGLKHFSSLISNKTFLLTLVRTLEGHKKFTMRDRVTVASLISVALQSRMEYATEILKTLLAELIEKCVEGKNHPKLLLRRTESVAEKMLTNWFTFLLYKFLRECAGEPLFMLYQAVKQQVAKGPVDAITSEARYSLSEDKLIRQQVEFKPMTIYVQDIDHQFTQSHPVKVLDCDTISHVKEKILDAIYKNAPFSSRPVKESVDLVLYASPSPEWEQGDRKRIVLSDVDGTSKQEGEFKRLNTLAHYQVPDSSYMALVPKQKTPSIYNLSITSDKNNTSRAFEYTRLENSVHSSRSPSLQRNAASPQVQVDIESNGNGSVKLYHLVKLIDQEQMSHAGDRSSKMVSEIYLTRLLATKGTLQQFVDDLFERIFSTAHRGTVLPLAIKYMFDFLDDQALLHNIQDPEVVHTWKSNSLPLRFWVNVIKNPQFVFDIYKSNIVDSCLSVVAQNFMDSCSMSEHRLGKDSPSSKLLYAKDIPTYKKWVERYYQDIKMMPAISDQDMTAMMAEESRSHQDEFNINAALYELYKYVEKYNDELVEALDDDEFARKNKLNLKLEHVHVAMKGEAYC